MRLSLGFVWRSYPDLDLGSSRFYIHPDPRIGTCTGLPPLWAGVTDRPSYAGGLTIPETVSWGGG